MLTSWLVPESVEACEQLLIHAYTHPSDNPPGIHLFPSQSKVIWHGCSIDWRNGWVKNGTGKRHGTHQPSQAGTRSHPISYPTGASLDNLGHTSRHCTPSIALPSGSPPPLSSTHPLRIPQKGYLTWYISKTVHLLSSLSLFFLFMTVCASQRAQN